MTRSWTHCTVRAAALSLVAIGLTACGDSAGPGDTFDPVASSEATAEALAPFTDNPGIDALFVLETALPALGGAAAAPAIPVPDSPYPALDEVRVLDRLLGFMSPTVPAVLFPADLLGKTLVYNPSTGQYEVDLEATDAPSNGIRIVLYAVDPIFHEPIEPLNAVGHLDLTDEGTAEADRVRVVVVIGSVTHLDYVASATVLTSGLVFSAVGQVSDGVTVVDFDLSHTWSEVDGFTLTYGIDVVGTDTYLDVRIELDPPGESVTFYLEVGHDGGTLILDLSATATALSGTVTADGTVVVEVSGTPEAPVFDAEGLTPEQQQALGELFDGIFELIEGFNGLLIPAYLVLQVSIALA
jgi:hypothetical protein